jgi:pimeloyl-ACP methyl ester carboxylesterase
MHGNWSALTFLTLSCALAAVEKAPAQTIETVNIRGHVQYLRVYGSRGGSPVIVSSGDGGWIHLAPHVAEVLAARGYFVVGFDVRAYLSSFTAGKETLRPEEEPADYKVLADFAARGSSERPLLIGVSEGAGLSVLAATEPRTRESINGVIAVGLPNINELGWRWRDAVIYVTHGTPHEPSFTSMTIVRRLTNTPLAEIHSTHDEFVPLAEAEKILEAANGPKRLWIIEASDHRFSDNQAEFDRRLLEAIAWVGATARH